jgi:salicylate hydroxylase
MHPKISPALPALLEEGLDGRRSRLGTRRLTAEQRPRRRRAARPNDAVADESRQSPLMLGVKAGSHGFEARDRASSVDDQDRRGEAIFRCYEEHNGRITAYFEDGTSVEGDVLVAADGGGSRVRRQFLPDAQRVETGVVGIAGKIFLDTARDRIARPLRDGISLVAARGGLGLFVALQEMTGGPIDGIGGNEPAFAGSGNLFENTRSYVMWALSAKREKFGLADPAQADATMLAAAARRAMAGWSHAFRDLVGLADPTTISCLSIRTSVPIAPWRTGRITLLGDAIHSMTPYRGIGANVAIKDAARLKRALVAAHRGERGLVEAIRDYETGMLDYGFRAVRNSLKAMRQTVTDSLPALMLSRLTMRAISALPPVKQIVARRLGEE